MLSTGYDKKVFQLVDEKTNRVVESGDTVTDFRGDTAVLDSGSAPHKPSSNGFVYAVKEGMDSASQSYAGVYGLKWVEVK